jgi:hypothetical protein
MGEKRARKMAMENKMDNFLWDFNALNTTTLLIGGKVTVLWRISKKKGKEKEKPKKHFHETFQRALPMA